jgi:hypothetical protein
VCALCKHRSAGRAWLSYLPGCAVAHQVTPDFTNSNETIESIAQRAYLEVPLATCHQAEDPTIFDWTRPPPPQSLIGNHAPPTTVEVETLSNRKREEDAVDHPAEVPPYHSLYIHRHHEVMLARLSLSASLWRSLGGTEVHDIFLNDQPLPSTTSFTASRSPTMVAMYHPPRHGAS